MTLVVISHGFSADRTSHDTLATSLAAAGYTVAAPTHPDMAGLSSNDPPRLDPLIRRLQRPEGRQSDAVGLDLEDHCTADTADVVLCGAAARARFEQLVSDPVDATDVRVDAMVLLAPGYGPLFSASDLNEIEAFLNR